MDKNFNIVLCGFMGCGKTTLGQQLASLTGREFIDTDAYIEGKTGLTINEIFAKYGEDYFRALEKKCISKVAQKSNCIIATGGGTVLDKDNVLSLKSNGKIFFLDVPFDVICHRVYRCTNRPLAQNLDKSNLKKLFNTRQKIYKACADFTVNATQP